MITPEVMLISRGWKKSDKGWDHPRISKLSGLEADFAAKLENSANRYGHKSLEDYIKTTHPSVN